MKALAGTMLFFGIGAGIALAAAFEMIESGSSVLSAITLGSCVGGYGGWFVFYVGLNTLHWFRCRRRTREA